VRLAGYLLAIVVGLVASGLGDVGETIVSPRPCRRY
jgi:hypothetical protein